MTQELPVLDADKLTNQMTRRQMLRGAAKSTVAGIAATGASYYGLSALRDGLLGVVEKAEKEVRELTLNIQALSGAIEKNLSEETDKLQHSYTSGKLKILEDLGVADPAELNDLGKIIENSQKFEEHYNFAERATIFKDRIDKKLLSVDRKAENLQPEAMQKVNDAIRGVFGKKRGEEGQRHRGLLSERLGELCRIYDTNEDNRVAETRVFESLNDYLNDPKDLTPEVRELFDFLRAEYRREGSKDHVKSFIRNYDRFQGTNDALLELRAYVTEAEQTFGKIKENKVYINRLQDLLKDGIKLKEDVRKKAPEEFEVHRSEIAGRVRTLKDTVDGVIVDLKSKGYPIETRQDYINRGTLRKLAGSLIDPVVSAGSGVAGAVAAGVTWLYHRKNARLNAKSMALEETVQKYNDLRDKYISAQEKPTEGETHAS